MTARQLAEYERAYPWIPWRQPVRVNVGDKTVIECRVCIGLHGLRGGDVGQTRGFTNFDDFATHMHSEHGVEADPPVSD